MRLDRVMIAAPGSGNGKTTVACAALELFRQRGIRVSACKCGPDYIDPMYHRSVIGVPSRNLDTFFLEEGRIRELLTDNREDGELVVLEGVMGLYDGLGGVRKEGSSYHLAQATRTPIILVVDAKGMGKSVVALLKGFLAYDTAGLIRGVILNRVSVSLCEILRPYIEDELGIALLGCLPVQKEMPFQSRYLGLCLPHELENLQEQLRSLAEKLAQTVSVEKLLQIAEEAEPLERGQAAEPEPCHSGQEERPVIAVARDEAFCFYYEDNLSLLQKAGAKLVFFSPLHEERLPENCAGLLLGGGYPELYAAELSRNQKMLDDIQSAAAAGIPMVAECGGFLYLHTFLRDREGCSYRMAGVLEGTCFYTEKLVRFGYVELREQQERFLPAGESIKGHEFHYYDSTCNGTDCLAVKPGSGKQYSCVISGENCFLGFPHLYYPSNPGFAERFVRKCCLFAESMRRNGD